ncbi:hypothetical protein ACHQM5_015924 [Ranunculus cassubicifolius]
MAFRKTLANQLYGITKISHSSIPLTNHSIFSASAALINHSSTTSSNYTNTTFCRDFMSDSGEKGFFRRFLQKRAIVQSATSSLISSTLIGEKMMSKLKEMNVNRDRIRLEGLYPPHLEKKPEPPEEAYVMIVEVVGKSFVPTFFFLGLPIFSFFPQQPSSPQRCRVSLLIQTTL